METKRCSHCGATKSVDDFCANKKWLSRTSWCKKCQREARRQRYAKKSPDERRQTAAKYRRQRPFVQRAKYINEKCRRKGIPGRISGRDIRSVFDAYNGKCWICGWPAQEVDHFRPTNRHGGGSNTASNIRPICTECNHKRDRQWRGSDMAEKEAALLRQLKHLLYS